MRILFGKRKTYLLFAAIIWLIFLLASNLSKQFQTNNGIEKVQKITEEKNNPNPGENETNRQKKLHKVVKVVDGDTIDIEINGTVQRIRLIGMDTPEIVDPRKAVQCFGKEASDKAKEMLIGKMITIESDITQGEKDKYDRLLRYVFLEDGTFFNRFMILEGFAHEYTYKSNPYIYQRDFIEAEKQARDNKRGLWNPNACNGQI